jgi:mRNA interferase RelE/StbE
VEKIRFEVVYDLKAEKHLDEINKTMRTRIKKAIEERLMIAPNDYGKPLTKEWKDHRRLRVGDYRIIYKVIEDKVIVFIVDIDHRKDIYEY